METSNKAVRPNFLRNPPPPPPPGPLHHHSSITHNDHSVVYDPNFDVDSVNNNSYYPYKTFDASIMTVQSGLMVLVVGAFFFKFLRFFQQFCQYGNKRDEYLEVEGYRDGIMHTPYRDRANNNLRRRGGRPGSPKHPAIKNTPPQSINEETMKFLEGRGIRLMAHGIQCEPRKVWLSMDEQSVIWQSEFQKELPDHTGRVSSVPVRGSMHRIDWDSIEFIDVGRRTDALKQAQDTVLDHLCFSLLTPNGSLDLQASSQLERDTLVSCIGMRLDEYKGNMGDEDEDWRAMYASPESSDAGVSSSAGGAVSYANLNMIGQPYRDLTVDV